LPKRSTITALALAALSLSACGSSSSSSSTSSSAKAPTSAGPSLSAFKSGFAQDKASFTKLGSALASAIQQAPKRSSSELATEFSSLAARTAAERAKLAKLDPPAKYKAQLAQLVADFGPVAADMTGIAKAASTNNSIGARNAAAHLVKDSAALKAVDVSLSSALGIPSVPLK
jgi:hypothetical protein